jgi:FkbM family methyltransferase
MPMLRQILDRALGKFQLQLLDTRRLPFGFSISGDLQLAGFRREQPLTVFDIGANRGDFTIQIAYDWPQAQIWSFEPSPTTFAALQRRLGELPARLSQRLHPEPLALGAAAQTGTLPLHNFGIDTLSSLHASTPYTASHGLTPQASADVTCLTGEDFCSREGLTSIDLLKIDTEGNDLQVLQGFHPLLRSGRIRAVLVEFNRIETAQDGSADALPCTDLLALARLLEPCGFILFTVHTDYVETERGLGVWNALFVRRSA